MSNKIVIVKCMYMYSCIYYIETRIHMDNMDRRRHPRCHMSKHWQFNVLDYVCLRFLLATRDLEDTLYECLRLRLNVVGAEGLLLSDAYKHDIPAHRRIRRYFAQRR